VPLFVPEVSLVGTSWSDKSSLNFSAISDLLNIAVKEDSSPCIRARRSDMSSKFCDLVHANVRVFFVTQVRRHVQHFDLIYPLGWGRIHAVDPIAATAVTLRLLSSASDLARSTACACSFVSRPILHKGLISKSPEKHKPRMRPAVHVGKATYFFLGCGRHLVRNVKMDVRSS
jgi:hypothetical protein